VQGIYAREALPGIKHYGLIVSRRRLGYSPKMTWMMDLGRSSLDDRDLAKQDACLGGLHGSYIVGTTGT
jgi:hypothetical protein